MREHTIKLSDSTYEKSCIEGVTEEQAGCLSRYELDMIFFILVSGHCETLCNRDDEFTVKC